MCIRKQFSWAQIRWEQPSYTSSTRILIWIVEWHGSIQLKYQFCHKFEMGIPLETPLSDFQAWLLTSILWFSCTLQLLKIPGNRVWYWRRGLIWVLIGYLHVDCHVESRPAIVCWFKAEFMETSIKWQSASYLAPIPCHFDNTLIRNQCSIPLGPKVG